MEAIKNIVYNAGNLKKGEKALILCDFKTIKVANKFKSEIDKATDYSKIMELPFYSNHGEEPSPDIVKEMIKADLIFCLTKNSLAHTQARINANNNGCRFLSLPDYSLDILQDKSLLINFKKLLPEVDNMTKILSEGRNATILSVSGTDLKLDITNRKGNCCAGFVDNTFRLGSPPDVEANIAPVETESNGIIFVDGSITCEQIGKLDEPVILEIRNGNIINFKSDKYEKILNKIFNTSSKRILAELGIGFNPEAKLCGNMLIDEGARGFIHFGFGSNNTIGGINNAGFHLDFVIKNPSLFIDDKIVINEGALL